MPIFELEGPDGQTYEVDAPDQGAAVSAFKKLSGASADPRDSALGKVDAFVRGAADTASFSFADEAAAGLNAAVGQGDYASNVARERATDKSDSQNRFWERTAGQVAGTVPLMFVPGLGWTRAANLGMKVARLAGSGALAGGLYGFGSGKGTPLERAPSAAEGIWWGAGTGVATPFVAKGVGNVARALLNRNTPNRAASMVARAATDDALTPQSILPALNDLGPDAMLADLGSNLQRQTGAIASVPGRGQEITREALTARSQGANARIRGDIESTVGPAPIPSRVDAGIVAHQRALSPEYEQAFAGARAVDTSDIATGLESAVVRLRGGAQSAARRVRGMLNVAGADELDRDPRTLFQTRQAIDGLLSGEADPNTIRLLTTVRQAVDDRLAQTVPGIKQVDAKFAELARQREALTRGQTVLDSGRTAPRPTELAEEVATGAQPQGMAVGPSAVPTMLRQGARAEIERIVGTTSNDVVALNRLIKGEGSWNRDRLATLFGRERADRIISVLDREKRFAETAQTVMRNSETAARHAAQQEIAPAASRKPGIVRSAMNMNFGDAIAKPIDWARGSTSAARQAATNEELAHILTTRAYKPSVQAVAKAMLEAERRRAIEDAAGRVLLPAGRGATPALTDMSPF